MIGIFDSGVGGLSVLNEVRALIPGESLLYFADSKNIPYGDKSEDFIRERSLQIAKFLKTKGIRLLVIACNTATAAGVDSIRNCLDIPVVAVEPPLKPAVAISISKTIGVIATKITLNSKRYKNLLNLCASNVAVIERPSNDLVPLVENFSWNNPQNHALLTAVVNNFIEKGVDAVVLGSTHFSFLKNSLIEISDRKLIPVGSAEATAQQVLKISKEKGFDLSGQGEITIFVSGDAKCFGENLKYFSEYKAEVLSGDC